MSDNVKLFVGNLPLDATHEEINKLFEPYGEIGTCSLLRQYAFITLKGEGAADRAIRYLDGKEYRGRPLVVEESRARPPNSTKVFVGNLSATCTADDLHGLFQTFGRVLDCDKVKARLCSNAGYAFVHMERKEDAVQAIEGLNGTVFKGRQLSVELSKAQPLNNLIAAGMAPHEGLAMGGGPREGLLPRPAPSLEHHQSQAAVLAAAAAAAAGLPIQVQQSVHNSFYNTTAFDPTYAALKGLTAAKGPNPAIYGALASQVYGSVADQVYQDGNQEANQDTEGGTNPTALFEAARAKFFQQGQKVLAEQQAGRKVGSGGAGDRDRSPIRGGRGPLLPDPVPGSAPQVRGKRRALLPTPPGGPEDPAEAPTATETPAASDATDPIARCYAEYYQQMQQYQNYQQYQQQYQYLQYAYTNPPPPPPPPPPSAAPPSSNNNNHHHANNANAPAPPGTYSTDSSTTYAPPVSYASSGGGGAGGYPSAGGYDVAAAARGYSAASNASYEQQQQQQQQQQQSSGSYGNSYDSSGSYDAAAAATGSYDASAAGSYASAYASTGGYAAAPGSYSAASRAYEQQTPTTAHGQSLPQQRHEYPYHHTPEPPYR